ncbi:MAG: hypothetical protein M1829_006508 [Trizodia sp. TS-e1964]|nr:MAG: hypothetical protein M1829_006508 [Trizodia sp. TS-e1964]
MQNRLNGNNGTISNDSSSENINHQPSYSELPGLAPATHTQQDIDPSLDLYANLDPHRSTVPFVGFHDASTMEGPSMAAGDNSFVNPDPELSEWYTPPYNNRAPVYMENFRHMQGFQHISDFSQQDMVRLHQQQLLQLQQRQISGIQQHEISPTGSAQYSMRDPEAMQNHQLYDMEQFHPQFVKPSLPRENSILKPAPQQTKSPFQVIEDKGHQSAALQSRSKAPQSRTSGTPKDSKSLADPQPEPRGEPKIAVFSSSEQAVFDKKQAAETQPAFLIKEYETVAPVIAPYSLTSTASTPVTASQNLARNSTPLSEPHMIVEKTSTMGSNLPSIQIPRSESTLKLSIQSDEAKPISSKPPNISTEEYARQCILAAYSSRLNPFALHPSESKLLQAHLLPTQATNYLNIRNGILRLWTRSPLLSVTRAEAVGCARDRRWAGVAGIAYEWLIRQGYINFGCVEVPGILSSTGNLTLPSEKLQNTKPIIIIGAGMAGLGCARQLDGLFNQFRTHWISRGMDIPKVIVLEARARIGGRIYSHPLRNQTLDSLPEGLRCTAEMGAQIITGFDRGNPLSILIRGQLGLHYHPIKDNSILYNVKGAPVDKLRDTMVEGLFNDILDRASFYRHKTQPPKTIEGDKELIEQGRDPVEDLRIFQSLPQGSSSDQTPLNDISAGLGKLAGKLPLVTGEKREVLAADSAKSLGWQLKPAVLPNQTINLDDSASSTEHPTLGKTMDEGLKQYKDLLELTEVDMQLLNWHFANLEYANAANVDDLSLSGWDQDIGNEFEGEHAEIIGGYLQVPRGLWHYPSKLDIRSQKVVKHISYSLQDSPTGHATIECEDGELYKAEKIVITVPLGVLKSQKIKFEPPLPDWKTGPIDRLGFGVLNKVVLVYEKPFWDIDRDMFGLLRCSESKGSLEQDDYKSGRGRFYLFWNCIKTSGRPVLVALMAGDAAHETEQRQDDDLVAEATRLLKRVFSDQEVPEPSEAIITRWGNDQFTRGSYSYVGPRAQPGDYDLMAKSVGNLYFAGEATCGTHPATVHGAYLSGLRAASEIIEAALGPIHIPDPLVPPKPEAGEIFTQGIKRKLSGSSFQKASELKTTRLEKYELELEAFIEDLIGKKPEKPRKALHNSFLLYQKDHWEACKAKYDEVQREASGTLDAKAGGNEVRATMAQMWRDASESERRPYFEQSYINRKNNTALEADFRARSENWARDAQLIRLERLKTCPSIPSEEEISLMQEAEREHKNSPDRKVKKISGYAEVGSNSDSDFSP